MANGIRVLFHLDNTGAPPRSIIQHHGSDLNQRTASCNRLVASFYPTSTDSLPILFEQQKRPIVPTSTTGPHVHELILAAGLLG